ncbi:MAG TPA: YcaO-like family protein [Thermoanaerobaculia bacterium]|nr:YcaO-like family protein [Thermoanaerobaculia bacterium]
MGQLSLKTEYLNPHVEALFYRMSQEEGEGLADLLAFYSPYGPLRKVVTYFGPAGGMPIHVGHSEYYDFDYMLRRITGLSALDSGLSQSLFAGGKGGNVPHMFISSLAEAVERVLGCLAVFEKSDQIVYASYRDMQRRGYECLGPGDIPLFADEQHERRQIYYERFTDDSFVGWIEGRQLLSGRKLWMPVQMVALFYSLRPDEALVGYSTSGGLASHISEREALFHGITELIERDAVNLRWVSKMAPLLVDLDREVRSPELANLLAMSRGLPGDFGFYLQTVDIPEVPVITVLQVCRWLKKWSYYAGGGVNLDIDSAMLQALTEFGQSERSLRLAQTAPDRYFAHGVRQMFDVPEDTPVSQIDIFFKIIAYYGYAKNVRKMDGYLAGERRINLSDIATDDSPNSEVRYQRLLAVLAKHKIDPIVFDFTPPQMKQVRLMKAYILELAPPYLHSKPLLGHPRFYEMPVKLGYRDSPLGFDDLLTDPMPYP